MLLGQIDALGVAASLDVEDAVIGPAVLVVADELPPDIGRQGRLAGSREAEEERDLAARPLVGAAVHREDAPLGHPVVHRREDGLLHFSGVFRSQDDHLLALQVEHDAGVRVNPGNPPVGRVLAGVEDQKSGSPKCISSSADGRIMMLRMNRA